MCGGSRPRTALTAHVAIDPDRPQGEGLSRISERLLVRLSGGLFLGFGLFSLQQALS